MTHSFRHPTATPAWGNTVLATPSPGERFTRVGKRQWGYKTQDVDEYLDRAEADLHRTSGRNKPLVSSSDVREVVFGRAKGGYVPADVDAALDQLEDAVARQENRAYIATHGIKAWEEEVGALSDLIFGRLERPDGHRFRRPSGANTRGYAVVDVDALCHAIVEELSTAEAVHPDRVRTAVFGPALREQAYEEQQVDAFLDALVQMLLALH